MITSTQTEKLYLKSSEKQAKKAYKYLKNRINTTMCVKLGNRKISVFEAHAYLGRAEATELTIRVV